MKGCERGRGRREGKDDMERGRGEGREQGSGGWKRMKCMRVDVL